MHTKKHSAIIRVAALLLIMAMLVPTTVGAEVQSRASSYLNSYNSYISVAGSGKIHICFSVIGVTRMDSLGALTIKLYESTNNSTWTWIKSYTNDTTPSMLGYDEYCYGNYMTYQGVAGRYYKAYVCIWAGKDGGGDTRYFWTSAKQAT